jgi:phage head maturation protease
MRRKSRKEVNMLRNFESFVMADSKLAKEDYEPNTVYGALALGVPGEIMKNNSHWYREKLAPDCFDAWFRTQPEIGLMFQHDTDVPYEPESYLITRDRCTVSDTEFLVFCATLKGARGMAALEEIESGGYGVSPGMTIRKYSWDDSRLIKTILEADLLELSFTPSPYFQESQAITDTRETFIQEVKRTIITDYPGVTIPNVPLYVV